MDSEAGSTKLSLSPAQGKPPQESDPKAASSPFSSSSSEAECFLSGDDEEPEFETASERPLAAEPDEEAAPEDELPDPAESAGSVFVAAGGHAPSAAVLTEELVGGQEVWPPSDKECIADADAVAPSPRLVEVEPAPPSPGLADGGDAVLKGNGHDDDDKGVAAVEIRASKDVVRGAEVENLDGAPGGNSTLMVNYPDEALNEVSTEEILPGRPVEEEVSKDGVAAPAELSYSNGSGDETAAGEEKSVLRDSGEGKNADLGGRNEEEVAVPDADAVGDLDVVKPQSNSRVIREAEDKPAFDGESERGELLGSVSSEEKSSVAQVEIELKPEAEPKITVGEGGVQCAAVSDDNLEMGSTLVPVESQGLQPSETKESIGYMEEEEKKALDSPVMKDRTGDVEEEEVLNVVHEIIPSEPKGEGDAIEQASTELQISSKEAECIVDADVSSVRAVELQSHLAEDANIEHVGPDNEVPKVFHVADNGAASVSPVPDSEMKHIDDGSDVKQYMGLNEGRGGEALIFDGSSKVAVLESSETAKQIIEKLDGESSGAKCRSGSSQDHANQIDGQVVSDSDEEEAETDDDGEGKELFDSAALAALLKAATGASADGTITISAPGATRTASTDRPAGLGSLMSSLRQAPARTVRPNLFSSSDIAVAGEPDDNMDEEDKKLQDMVDQIRVKFLRLVHRLGYSPEDRVAAQVLYRLGLAEGIRRGRQIGRAFNIDNAKKKALQLEEDGKEPLDFSCNILVLGKSGVGKSATINSIFGEEKVHTNAFEPATPSVKEIIGTVDGIKICVTDTPGLRPSVLDQSVNSRILSSIKKYTKKCPPDIVLYVDRLDTQTWDFNDLPLLRSITSILGSSIWFNAIVALTHAASAPPDGSNGIPLSYEVFVDQRSRIVQHAIRQAAGDMRLMNPVALVENHPSCRKNREGQRVLPNGQSWRTQMLLLCYSSKILSEANSLLKLQDSSPGKLFGFRVRSPPLPFLLSSLLQSRAHPKLATDNGVDDDSDIDLGDISDSDQEEDEDQYDQLPPFKPLRKAQIAKLTKEQMKAYFDEYDYRVKLLQKKQWKEEIRRLKEMRKTGKSGQDESGYGDMADDYDQDSAPAAVPVPLPDMVLPPSFDCENPAYRYRFLEPTSQLLARPVLDTHGWDHDCGYDGVSLEENLAIAGRHPAAFAIQVTKDKKEFSIHLDSSISAKHGGNGSTLAGFDIQSVGKQLAYIIRSETKFKNLKKNKTTAGISVTFLGENIATGLKVEDQLSIGKRLGLVASTGAVRAQGDVAYGANLEMRLRGKDFPIGQDVSTLGLSLMRWRSDLALGANLQSQFSVGRNSKMAVRVGLNNKLSGQITVRTSTSDQLHIALLGILPLAVSIYRSICSGESY